MKTNKYTYLKVIQQNLSGKWKDIEEVEANSIYIPKCGESIFKTLLSGYKLLGVSTKTINRRVINEKTSLRQNFKDVSGRPSTSCLSLIEFLALSQRKEYDKARRGTAFG